MTSRIVGLACACCVLIGCGDQTPPAWGEGTALTADTIEHDSVMLSWAPAIDEEGVIAYQVTRDGQPAGEVAANGTPHLGVTDLAEFADHAFAVTAVDEAGNTSPPLALQVKTLDITPPVWAEDCEWSVDIREPDALDKGLEVRWCDATDNDRVDRFVIRRSGTTVATATVDVREHHLAEPVVDGHYVVAACDPSGNCSNTTAQHIGVRMEARRAEISEAIASSSILALLGDYQASDSIWGSGELLGVGSLGELDAALMDVSGVGVAWGDSYGSGGLGSRGSGQGGGGTAEGLGGLGTRGTGGTAVGYGGLGSSRSYDPPTLSVSGGDSALVAHVNGRKGRLDGCYSTALRTTAGLSGAVTIALSTDAAGKVSVGSVGGAGDGSLHGCVSTSLLGHMAAEPGESLSGTVTLSLDPGSR
jgi:hypothetical protein